VKKKHPDISAERLREVMTYDPETGVFRRRIQTRRSHPPGAVVGSINNWGYVVFRVDGIHVSGSRAAWLYMYGRLPDQYIDHIDGNRQNNAIRNLREASAVENGRNNAGKGYCLDRSGSGTRYRAYIYVNKKQINLGCYSNENDARAAYIVASKTYFGQFSAANRPPASSPAPSELERAIGAA